MFSLGKKKENKKKKPKKKNVCWDMNMIAVVLFLNTNMAEVTSCKYRYLGFEIVLDWVRFLGRKLCIVHRELFYALLDPKKFPHHCQTILLHLACVN